jgi:hypothetical protein
MNRIRGSIIFQTTSFKKDVELTLDDPLGV